MIRLIRQDDIPRLKELGLEHEIGADFIEGICAVDEHGDVVMFAGAWSRAEVHVALDRTWGTPGARLALFGQVHDAMEQELRVRGVGQAVTWFGGEMKRFKTRLAKMGWVKSELTSWHRRVNGI